MLNEMSKIPIQSGESRFAGKNNFTFLYFILVITVFASIKTTGQENPTPPTEFPVGAFMYTRNADHRTNQALYNSFEGSGMNIMVQHSDGTTDEYIKNKDFDLIADNLDEGQHWIPYYASGFYSKWESEENQPDPEIIGVKHKHGQSATWHDTTCWSSLGVTAPADSLVFGPHYWQERKYKREYQSGGWYSRPVEYTARFRMALDNPQSVPPVENVCVIKAVHRYILIDEEQNWSWHDTVLLQRTLTEADFNANGSFNNYSIGEPPYRYQYDERFYLDKPTNRDIQELDPPIYYDWHKGTGIQFCVDWLRDDNLCTLYIDYSEVYDNDGWNFYVTNPGLVEQNITLYTQNYSDWSNLRYWYGHDEPLTIDAITPMRVVDSLVQNEGGAPLITALNIPSPLFYEPRNGEYFHRRYLEQVQP